jgi:hypothetical protein
VKTTPVRQAIAIAPPRPATLNDNFPGVFEATDRIRRGLGVNPGIGRQFPYSGPAHAVSTNAEGEN